MKRTVLQLIFFVLVCSGCAHPNTGFGGGQPYARKDKPSRFVYLQTNSLPQSISTTDYRSMESIIGSFKLAGDLVVVTGVFDMLGSNPETFVVMYRTKSHDYILVKDWQGIWRLSHIALAPE